MPATLFFWALLSGFLALTASGCANDRASDALDSMNLAEESSAVAQDPVEGAAVSLVVPDTVAQGVSVPIRVRVLNTTSAPLDLYLRGREIAFDVTIIDSTGSEFWTRLEGETIPAILQLKTLAPGEVLELSHDWDQRNKRGRPAEAGVYSVRASVLTDGSSSLAADEASFVIRPDG